MRRISFTPTAFNEYNEWIKNNPAVAGKIIELIRDISRSPFSGIGKPESLKGNYKGFWSRRITREHRLIYKVEADSILVVKCRGHYE
ncbi:MAG TPA: Txe/YoeB family addiction module toxin [Bacteroidia bacterium]|nr:Txe/YoeB family addiction module toxin [Bacteroidia bacterium]